MRATCPCGGVTVEVAHAPEYLNSCNCSLCFRLGPLWGYFDPKDVTILGKTAAFVRDDIEQWLSTHFCPGCGATTHWQFLPHRAAPRMGVNMRLFGPDALIGIPVRFNDGAAWTDDSPERPPPRHAEIPFAHDHPF